MRLGGDDPRPVGEALASVAAELGLPPPSAFSTLVERWTEMVGDDLAGHVIVESLRDGCLTVGARSPIWASQFRYLSSGVLERVAAVVGDGVVTRVAVRVRAG